MQMASRSHIHYTVVLSIHKPLFIHGIFRYMRSYIIDIAPFMEMSTTNPMWLGCDHSWKMFPYSTDIRMRGIYRTYTALVHSLHLWNIPTPTVMHSGDVFEDHSILYFLKRMEYSIISVSVKSSSLWNIPNVHNHNQVNPV